MKLTQDEIVLLERMTDNSREHTQKRLMEIGYLYQKTKDKKKREQINKQWKMFFEGWQSLLELSLKLQRMRK